MLIASLALANDAFLHTVDISRNPGISAANNFLWLDVDVIVTPDLAAAFFCVDRFAAMDAFCCNSVAYCKTCAY